MSADKFKCDAGLNGFCDCPLWLFCEHYKGADFCSGEVIFTPFLFITDRYKFNCQMFKGIIGLRVKNNDDGKVGEVIGYSENYAIVRFDDGEEAQILLSKLS